MALWLVVADQSEKYKNFCLRKPKVIFHLAWYKIGLSHFLFFNIFSYDSDAIAPALVIVQICDTGLWNDIPFF